MTTTGKYRDDNQRNETESNLLLQKRNVNINKKLYDIKTIRSSKYVAELLTSKNNFNPLMKNQRHDRRNFQKKI